MDINPKVIQSNSKFTKANWINDDILSAMENHCDNNIYFNPSVVNCDFIGGPETQSKKFASIVSFLTNRKIKDILCIGNFVMKHRYKQDSYDINSILYHLKENKDFNKAISSGWELFPKCYLYRGTGNKSATEMVSLIFYNK